MKLNDFIINEFATNSGKKLAYVSKNVGKIKALHNLLVSGVNVADSNTRIFGVHPIGVNNLPEGIDVVLYETTETSEEHLLKHVKFNKKFLIYEIKDNELGLSYAEDRSYTEEKTSIIVAKAKENT